MEINKENYDKLKARKLLRREIAEIFNLTEWQLKKLIAKNKWGIVRPAIQNKKAFSEESEEAYYIAGFIAADGNISDANDLYVCLNYDDTIILEKILKYLQSNHKISSNTDKYYRSQIGLRLPEDMATILQNKFNIIPRKSLIYTLPNITASPMFKHYLRGYFDGDGCICESFSNKNSTTATLYTSIVGSNLFINDLYKVLYNIIGITGIMQNKGNVDTIRYNTNSSKMLLKYLYEDSTIFLPRKYQLYNNIIVNSNRKTRVNEV